MPNPQKSSRTEDAYQRLRREILDNQLPPGTQMSEPEYAIRLGMSRTPVHEALLRLEAEGLVKLIPRHGARVLAVSVEDLREIYEILTSLEPQAAGALAMRKPSRAQLAGLERATIDMEQALEALDLEAWAEADRRYHREVLLLHGNSRLIGVVQTLCDQAHRARMLTLREREFPRRSTEEHRQILEAIVQGEGERAHDLLYRHRQRAAREILGLLEQQ